MKLEFRDFCRQEKNIENFNYYYLSSWGLDYFFCPYSILLYPTYVCFESGDKKFPRDHLRNVRAIVWELRGIS